MILPPYPKTPHLPHLANMSEGDELAEGVSVLVNAKVLVEEKIDGANCAMMLHEGHPIIRGREKFIKKGNTKDTPAQKQFAPIWNWFYDNKNKFEMLNEFLGFEAGVYGEWLYALHGIKYDLLPDYFIAYEIYDPDGKDWIDPAQAKVALARCGFETPPLLYAAMPVPNYEFLENLCSQQSDFSSTDLREGIYVKERVGNTTKRYKMVRQGYQQGCRWDQKKLAKQKLRGKI